jgi:CRISPR/Cas system CSM-associated protein Csm4 (group 5 of RAMP superfamily)
MFNKRELKHIGKNLKDYHKRQNRDNEQMRVRCLESVFGNGNRNKIIDIKNINWKHTELLRKFGYIKRTTNIGSIFLTDKAFDDWETICQERLFNKLEKVGDVTDVRDEKQQIR